VVHWSCLSSGLTLSTGVWLNSTEMKIGRIDQCGLTEEIFFVGFLV